MFCRFFLHFFCFFLCFFPSTKTMRQPFSGTAERIFMKLLPNDTGENVVFNVVPKVQVQKFPFFGDSLKIFCCNPRTLSR